MRTSFTQRLKAAWAIVTGAPNEGVVWRCVWRWRLDDRPCDCPQEGYHSTGVRFGGCGWVILRNVGAKGEAA